MAEKEIVDLLKKLFKQCKKDFPDGIVCLSVKDISEKLSNQANRKNIEKAISQLQKFKEIESIRVDVDIARKIYGKNTKKGLQLFFTVED